MLQRGDVETSLTKYTAAFLLSPRDHLVTSNRSHALLTAGRLDEALEDADRTVSAKPDWGKGYFRRGMALAAMGDTEDALVAFFQCLVLDESCSKALRTEIYKVLFKLVSQKQEDGEQSTSQAAMARFLSQQDLRTQVCVGGRDTPHRWGLLFKCRLGRYLVLKAGRDSYSCAQMSKPWASFNVKYFEK